MKSKINEAKITKRFVTEQYAYEEYTLGAIVDDSESGVEVLKFLKQQINEAFIGGEEVEEVVETKKVKKPKKEVKNDKPTSIADDENTDDEDSSNEDAGNDGKSDQDDEATDDEDCDNSDSSSDEASDESADEESDDDSGDKEDTSPKKGKSDGKKGSSKKRFTKKPQQYSRGIEEHKKIFSGLIGLVNPDWKKSDVSKKRAKNASESLDGVDFLDENGEVLPSFKTEVKKLMGNKK